MEKENIMKVNKHITISVISMLLIAGSALAANNKIKIAPLTDSTILPAIVTPSLRVLVKHHINTAKVINNYDGCHTKLFLYSNQDDQRTIDLTDWDSPGQHNTVPAS